MSHIPRWIKAEHFEKILKDSVPKFKEIKKFSVYDALAPGENYVAIALKVQIEAILTDNTLCTESFFLKVAPDNELYNTQMYKWNVFVKETEVYHDFIPDFEDMYRAAGVEMRFGAKIYDLPVQHEYLLLEDLSRSGFKNVNRQESLDMEHCRYALMKLAQWHAASAVRVQRSGPYDKLYWVGSINPDGEILMRAMNSSAIKNVLGAANDFENHQLYYKQLEELSHNYTDFLFENIAYNPDEFNVLNHGDFWCNNIMFQYDVDNNVRDAYIIDYQMAVYGSPGIDLIYFIMTSVQLDLKIAHFDELIKFYYDHLIANLKLLKYSKPLPSLGDIHKSIVEARAYGAFAAFSILPLALADSVESANLENVVGDGAECEEHKMQMYKQERIRKHLELVLPWMHFRGFFETKT